MLNAVVTSLISVTALVFSLTVVALQLSSSQYTPRLLQTFVAFVPGTAITFAYLPTLDGPLHLAAGQPAVLRRIARLLREVAWRASPGSLDADIRCFVDRLVEVARTSTGLPGEEPARWRAEVEAALLGE